MVKKRKIFIQWDSTNNCNLKCSHCYHNREGEEHATHNQGKDLMSLEEVVSMIDDLNNTSKRWKMLPRFQISGGEPLMREDLPAILEYTKKLGIETRILTNGTLITHKKANELYRLGVRRLQISIDGSRKRHNLIRGRDFAYDLAIRGVKNCAQNKIDVTISMTALQSNKDDFDDVIKNAIRAGAKYVGTQSYVPSLELGINDPEFLDCRALYELNKKTRELEKKYGNEIKILQTEVLWHLMQWDTKRKKEARNKDMFLSGCGAGWSGLSVLSDGTVYPCRRLPIPIGNIKEGFSSLMVNNPILQDLRDFDKMRKNADGCIHIPYCRGCRAIAYATTGDYLAKDPMCYEKLVKPEDIQPRVIRR